MHKQAPLILAAVLGLCALTPAAKALTLENFESGSFPAGWVLSGSAWSVGGATGSSPNIVPLPGGAQFARSGAPNTGSPPLAESAVGSATSPAYQVSFDTLSWNSVGWSGNPNNGLNYFQVLDASFAVKTTIVTAQSDAWKNASVNLLAIGLAPGATFHFRAVDGNNANNYAWLAFDNLSLGGTPTPAVPEPAGYLMLAAGLAGLGALRRTRRDGPRTA